MFIKFHRKLPEEHWVNQPSAVYFDPVFTIIMISPKGFMLIIAAVTMGIFLHQQHLILQG